MRFSHPIQFLLGLAPLLISASAFAAENAVPAPIDPGLTEGVEKRLIQFEVRLTRKGVPVSGLTANDIDIELGGRPLKTFTLDDMCVIPTSTSAKRSGSSILYFDEPELTVEGRQRAVEVARLLAPALLAHNHDLLIIRNGKSVRAETTWTHDADEIAAALDRIASDPGHMDYLRDAADEGRVQQLVEQAKDTLVSANMEDGAESRSLGNYGCNKHRRPLDTTTDGTIVDGLAAEIRTVVNQELQRGGRDIERLRNAISLLSTREAPKEIIYFADTLRGDPGRLFTQALSSVNSLNRSPTDPHAASTLTAWNSDGAIQSLVREAATYGVRFYAVEGRGLAERTDWIRTAQNTLISIALDTGGLSFVNGLDPSVIVDRVNRDQSCWYLVSFDPMGWNEDRTLSIGVYGKQSGLRALTSSWLVIPSRAVSAEARLVSAHFGDASGEEQP
jgi:hypothetical protein